MLARALAAHQRGAWDEARRLYAELLAAQPGHADALHLLAVLDYQQGRFADALAGLERALAVAPQLAPAWSNRSALLRDLGRPAEALESAERALALQPGDARAANNRAAALLDLGRAADALPVLQEALARDAADPALHHNLGKALLALGRPDEACAAFEAALARDPGLAASRAGLIEARAARGEQWLAQGRGEAGLAELRAALDEAPHTPFLRGRWLHAALKQCDWRALPGAIGSVAQALDAGEPCIAPFVALHLPLSRAQLRQAARGYAATLGAPGAPLPPAAPAADGRLRVGFFSPDFREHATARLVVGLIEALDRRHVQAIAWSLGPVVEDGMRQRLRAAFEHFEDAGALDDAALVQRARAWPLDIAIDLAGPTRHARPALFARRLAPLQLAWLGFPGTQGAPWFDALLADATVVPPAHAGQYDEPLLRLPHSYQPNDPRRERPRAPPRAALGLPAQGLVFAALHGAAKLEPGGWARWMRLLLQRPGSVLWLLQPDAGARARLEAAAAEQGVDPARLVFAPRLPAAAHLDRLAAADLALDTFVCNGHTTTSDALWAGVPVLTCVGETFASRVAASLLHAAGLPELVAPDAVAYERLALALTEPGGPLPALRARLHAARDTCPLFDAPRFARAFEAALSALWQRRGGPRVGLQVLEHADGRVGVVEDAPVAEPARAEQPPARQ